MARSCEPIHFERHILNVSQLCLKADRHQLKEAQLRQWYHLTGDLLDPESGATYDEHEVLMQTDSEQEQECLLQTESESEIESSGQDEGGILLASSSENEGVVKEPNAKRRKYTARSKCQLTFLGKAVCKYSHARLFGIGAKVLQNLREGRAGYTMTGEERLREPKHPTLGVWLVRSSDGQKWKNILAFMWLLYSSCAEILPTKLVMPKDQFESFTKSDPDFEERYVQTFMQTLEKNFDLNPAPR